MKKTVLVILDLMLLILIGFFSLISPYAYEWDPLLKTVDADKLLVLRLIWIGLITAISGVTLYKYKCRVYLFESAKGLSCVFYIALLGYCAFKIIGLFLI